MKKLLLLIPLGLFLVLVAFFYRGLWLDPHEVPSPLIGKAAPTFNVTTLTDEAKRMTPADLRGKVWVLNVFASWCVACQEEHALLVDYSRQSPTLLIGLNYKDTRPDALGWLRRHGNPYRESLFDGDGRIGIDYGVYGVPETFVIDKAGVIRYKHIGPLTPEVLREKIDPLLKQLDA